MFKDAVINLILNKANFLKSVADVKKGFSGIGQSFQGAFDKNLAMLSNIILSAKAIGSVFQDVKKTVDFSNIYNVNAEAVSRWKNQLALFGGNAEEALSIQKKFQEGINDFRTEGKGLFMDLAKQFAITPQKGNGQFLQFDEFIEKAREVYKTSNEVGKQKLLTHFENNPAILRLLQATNEEFKSTLEKSKLMGETNDRMAKTVVDFSVKFQTLLRLAKNAGVHLLEVLNPLINIMNIGIEKFMGLSEGTKKFIASLFLIKPAFAVFSLVFNNVKALIGSFKGLFKIFKGIFKIFMSGGVGIRLLKSGLDTLYLKVLYLSDVLKSILTTLGGFKGIGAFALLISSTTFFISQLVKLKDTWWDVIDMFKHPIKSLKTIGGEVKTKYNENKGKKKADEEFDKYLKEKGMPPYDTEMIPTPEERKTINNKTINNTNNKNMNTPTENKTYTFKFGDIIINGTSDPKKIGSQFGGVLRQATQVVK
jgi:hypothetical protein